MGDVNPIRTLGDYSKPSHEGYKNTIELPEGNNVVPLRSDTIRLVQNRCSFHELWSEDPNQHLKDFLKLVDSLDLDGDRSITTWEDLTNRFLVQFFPPGRTVKLHNDILMFQQHQGESFSKAWTRFKDLLQKVPHHGIDLWLKVQIFYDHVNPVIRRTFDQSANGKLHDRNAEESWALLEDLALYDNESWNNPRDFAKLVKAISLPQDVPMHKITSLCEICGGPHDTQYCIENPEQAFVDYASSRIDEAGGLVSNFMAYQNARLSKFKADFKQQQSEMTNKIDTVLKAITDRIDGALPSDMVKNPKLNVNSTSSVLSARSYPMEDPQCSYQIHANAYIDVDLPMNIMSFDYYNTIRKNRYEYMGRNFIGLGRDMHVFVGNMSYVMNFTILENIETNIDPNLSHVIFGRPFIEIACLAINRKHGLITFTDGTKEITFKTPYKDLERSELSSEGHDLLSSRIILSEDDYDRGYKKPSDLEDGFYRDTIKLGHEYMTEKEDEGEVT
ncbi:zinc finger, CCHC-type containing protein [Tanacetum coccineum]